MDKIAGRAKSEKKEVINSIRLPRKDWATKLTGLAETSGAQTRQDRGHRGLKAKGLGNAILREK